MDLYHALLSRVCFNTQQSKMYEDTYTNMWDCLGEEGGKKNGCFIQMETELRHFSSLASFVFCSSCGNLFAAGVKKHH